MSRRDKNSSILAPSAIQHAIGKSKIGSILPDQITSNFIMGNKVQEVDLENIEREKSDPTGESEKESALRKRRNIMSKSQEYNLPTADKLIKPVGANEHAGKTTSQNVMSQHAVNLR